MAKRRVPRLKIGDVIEITTPRGFGYAQCTHRNELMGHLIKVFPGIHKHRIEDFESLVEQPDGYYVFVIWGSSLQPDILRIVGRVDVPEESKPFPLFRGSSYDARTKTNGAWYLWDGNKEWIVHDLAPEQWNLPLYTAYNDVALADKVASGWRPEGKRF